MGFLRELSQEVKQRMDAISVKGRCVSLKLMVRRADAPAETAKFMGHGICTTSNKSANLPVATNDAELISREVVAMFRMMRGNNWVSAADIRGVGIQVTKLEHPMSVAHAKALRGAQHGKPGSNQSILQFTVPKNKLNFEVSTAAKINSSASTSLSKFAAQNPNIHISELQDEGSSAHCHGNNNNIPILDETHKSTTTGVAKADTEIKTSNVSKQRHVYDAPKPGCSKEPDSPPPPPPSPPSLPSHPPPPQTRSIEIDQRLSMSQIDSQVLAALPPDIAKEVLSSLRDGPGNVASTVADARNLEEKNKMSPKKAQQRNLDISFSEVDQDIFMELPVELQDEIRNEYSQARKTRASSKVPVAPIFRDDRNAQKGRSPTKLGNAFKTPAGAIKSSKTKRGRPPGGGKSKLKSSTSATGSKQKQQKSTKTSVAATVRSNIPADYDEDVVLVRYEDNRLRNTIFQNVENSASASSSASVSEVKSKQVVDTPPPSLCGAESVSEVRSLLKEWIHSVPEPQQDDLDQVKDYLTSLVAHRNLEQVFYLLKFLCRVTNNKTCGGSGSGSNGGGGGGSSESEKRSASNDNKWSLASKHISDHVQSVICGMHGATLKLR